MPPPRSPDDLLLDPETAAEMSTYMVALIPFEDETVRQAAE